MTRLNLSGVIFTKPLNETGETKRARARSGFHLSSFDRSQFGVAKNVHFLSKTYPQVNESYEKLLWTYWEVCDNLVQRDQGVLFILESETHKLSKAESIDRAWRKLVAEGEIVLTEKQVKARSSREKDFRKFYGQTKLVIE